MTLHRSLYHIMTTFVNTDYTDVPIPQVFFAYTNAISPGVGGLGATLEGASGCDDGILPGIAWYNPLDMMAMNRVMISRMVLEMILIMEKIIRMVQEYQKPSTFFELFGSLSSPSSQAPVGFSAAASEKHFLRHRVFSGCFEHVS